MSRQTLAVIVGATVLFAGVLVGTLTFTGNDSGADNVHTMPDGQTMTGPMTTGAHTMPSGETMPGAGMSP